MPFRFHRRNRFFPDGMFVSETFVKCRASVRCVIKYASRSGTDMRKQGYREAHNEPGRHANFTVQGLGEGRHQEEHDEE